MKAGEYRFLKTTTDTPNTAPYYGVGIEHVGQVAFLSILIIVRSNHPFLLRWEEASNALQPRSRYSGVSVVVFEESVFAGAFIK